MQSSLRSEITLLCPFGPLSSFIQISLLVAHSLLPNTLCTFSVLDMSKYIKAYTKIPKELFRLNNGPKIRLRAYPSPFRPARSFDILTEGGAVKPKALNPETYDGKTSSALLQCRRLRVYSAKWCLDAPKHRNPIKTRQNIQSQLGCYLRCPRRFVNAEKSLSRLISQYRNRTA